MTFRFIDFDGVEVILEQDCWQQSLTGLT